MYLEQQKWSRKDRTLLYKSSSHFLQMKSPQLYYPIMSLYFYIHNTPESHKCIDFKRNYYLKNITAVNQTFETNSNSILSGEVYDTTNDMLQSKDIFCKCIPLLDPIHFILNNYSIYHKRNPLLP